MEKNNKEGYKKGIVKKNIQIYDNIYKMTVKGDFKGNPGQFYMLKGWEDYPILPRPLSISDINNNEISFLYMLVGKGTRLFSQLKPEDKIELLGPLGNGFDLNKDKDKKIAIVAGGIGIAPMEYLAKELEGKIDLYCGFATGSYYTGVMGKYVDEIFISTDDGSVGYKGFVTDMVKDEYDIIYACGPNPMMNSLVKRNLNANIYLSLESKMACGIGACLGCAIETTNGIKRVCHDGPVFNSQEVIF